jgi:hypothetical protein
MAFNCSLTYPFSRIQQQKQCQFEQQMHQNVEGELAALGVGVVVLIMCLKPFKWISASIGFLLPLEAPKAQV